jgi:hypothetical protein
MKPFDAVLEVVGYESRRRRVVPQPALVLSALAFTLPIEVVVRQNLVRTDWIAFRARIVESMPAFILCLFRFLRLLYTGQQALAVENLALRRQLVAYKRRCKRPLLNDWDRLFWIGLSRVWTG